MDTVVSVSSCSSLPFSPAPGPLPGERKLLVTEGPRLGATQPMPSAAEMSDACQAQPRLQGLGSKTNGIAVLFRSGA